MCDGCVGPVAPPLCRRLLNRSCIIRLVLIEGCVTLCIWYFWGVYTERVIAGLFWNRGQMLDEVDRQLGRDRMV